MFDFFRRFVSAVNPCFASFMSCTTITLICLVINFASPAFGQPSPPQTILRVDGNAGSPTTASPPPTGLDWGARGVQVFTRCYR